MFHQETVPRALRERHTTKAGVWALLHVMSGAVELVELQEGERRQTVTAGHHAVICPEVEHHLVVGGEVALYLELWRAEAAEPDAPAG